MPEVKKDVKEVTVIEDKVCDKSLWRQKNMPMAIRTPNH